MNKLKILILCLLIGLLGLGGCGSPALGSRPDTDKTQELVFEKSLELEFAKNFSVDYYRGGYRLLTLMDDTKYLVVPEGMDVPEGLEPDIAVLRQPLDNIYLVASSAMNIFAALGAVDSVTLSGQKQEGWYVDEAAEAMQSGKMLYAGKYNKPDYELILSKGCSLAIENMMISHSPEVVEKLRDFQIPVIIDYSSYENHPMARVEWVKFYGALLGREELAQELFDSQLEILDRITDESLKEDIPEDAKKTAAFFFVTSNGLVQVRCSDDYVPKMIELAGGRYIFDDLESDSKRSTLNMQIEDFYDGAKDADYLIYNSAIDGGISSVEQLLEKCPVLQDFKAVKNGNVWCSANEMYQQSMSIGYLIEDIHEMLTGNTSDGKYLFHLE